MDAKVVLIALVDRRECEWCDRVSYNPAAPYCPQCGHRLGMKRGTCSCTFCVGRIPSMLKDFERQIDAVVDGALSSGMHLHQASQALGAKCAELEKQRHNRGTNGKAKT